MAWHGMAWHGMAWDVLPPYPQPPRLEQLLELAVAAQRRRRIFYGGGSASPGGRLSLFTEPTSGLEHLPRSTAQVPWELGTCGVRPTPFFLTFFLAFFHSFIHSFFHSFFHSFILFSVFHFFLNARFLSCALFA